MRIFTASSDDIDTRYYKCILRRITDTNNIKVDILCAGNVWLHGQRLRLYGITMPNYKSNVPEIKKAANISYSELKKFIVIGKEYIIKIYGRDKLYCEVFVDGMNLNEYLYRNGFGLYNLVKDLIKN